MSKSVYAISRHYDYKALNRTSSAHSFYFLYFVHHAFFAFLLRHWHFLYVCRNINTSAIRQLHWIMLKPAEKVCANGHFVSHFDIIQFVITYLLKSKLKKNFSIRFFPLRSTSSTVAFFLNVYARWHAFRNNRQKKKSLYPCSNHP